MSSASRRGLLFAPAGNAVKCLSVLVMVVSVAVGGCAATHRGADGTATGTLRMEDLARPEDAGVWEAGDERVSWEAEPYRLQPGDEMQVSVLYNSNLSASTRVLPDGTISVPILGQMPAVGKTPQELADVIASGLSELIVDPRVSVIVTRLAGNYVFILGEVKNPGTHPISGQYTVAQAVAAAGGATNSAKLNSVLVIRRTSPDTVTGIRVSLDKVLKNRKLSEDRILRAYDIVYVPTTFIGRVDNFLSQFFAQTSSPWLWYIWARRAIDWESGGQLETPVPE
ncbi:MAG: polysaccharide export protein [Candidatus Eiseniibacteriota bacterium]|nr:MAG: polysaccharide export protein [Candidatus Eisenbacteria bacterium]